MKGFNPIKKVRITLLVLFLFNLYQVEGQSVDWFQEADFPSPGRSGATSFVIGTNGYIGLGTDGTTHNTSFFKYDASSGMWSPIADYPGSARRGSVAFAIDGKG